ncbi:MAG TPA: hypothetical protein VNJ52_09495 [Patescibacteria group bacterium]|nr:hypothetical protein [Patescibacteria group bacterium]
MNHVKDGSGSGVSPVTFRIYLGLFFLTAGTLMQEVLLTRIFSVTMWYDFAFLAISLAMFGMTVGALVVYLRPKVFTGRGRQECIAGSSLLFAASAVLSVLIHLNVPVDMRFSLHGVFSLSFNYLLMSSPFFFSGIGVCAVLTGFPRQVGKLYAADLAGAAGGCLGVLVGLAAGGVAGTVFGIGVLGAGAALLFADGPGFQHLRRTSIVVGTALLLLAVANGLSSRWGSTPFRLRWAKGMWEPRPLYEKWNSFSRVAVWGNPNVPDLPASEGLSSTYQFPGPMRVLDLAIDEDATTPLIGFHGDWNQLGFLKYDVKNLCYWLRPGGKALIIGAGGGRDVLSALLFKERSIQAVEVNPAILDALLNRFGEFTGHLDRYPGVKFVNDEGRSYTARQKKGSYDVIQASFVDTWAATAAGAFTLSENSLYTVQAWKLFLSRLTPHGILSFSRWYLPAMPGETYRLTSLAATALREQGAKDPRNHIVVLANSPRGNLPGASTILVSPSPFSAADIALLDRIAGKMRFDVLLSPAAAANPVWAELATGDYQDPPASALPLKLSPPTDDSPFFFNLVTFRDAFRSGVRQGAGTAPFNVQAVVLLEVLLAIVFVLTLGCVFVPLFISNAARRKEALQGAAPYIGYFAAIGLGFMLVEVSAVERVIVLLGSPTYALSVVLLVLLLGSALGSFSTRTLRLPDNRWAAGFRLWGLAAVLAIFCLLGPKFFVAYAASGIFTRIGIATAWLLPMGFFMGMAFPLGFRLAADRSPHLTPWLWGINGAASVCASVLAVTIAMAWTISAAFWTGIGCYMVAATVFVAVVVRAPEWLKRGSLGESLPASRLKIELTGASAIRKSEAYIARSSNEML